MCFLGGSANPSGTDCIQIFCRGLTLHVCKCDDVSFAEPYLLNTSLITEQWSTLGLWADTRLSTGIAGLDDILHGGLAKGFLYLIEGNPGAGKTTLALQFLIAGAKKGEKGLYISLAESETELRHVADSHGLNLQNVWRSARFLPPEIAGDEGKQYTVFQPAEVELSDVLETILAKVREINPSRVIIDSMSELRMLARDSLRYRRQVLEPEAVL